MLKVFRRDQHGCRANQSAWHTMLIFLGIIFVVAIGALLKDFHESKRIRSSQALRSFYDTVPDVPLDTLEASRRENVLRQLNSSRCVCECALTLAQCRNTDRRCQKSLELALQLLNEPLR